MPEFFLVVGLNRDAGQTVLDGLYETEAEAVAARDTLMESDQLRDYRIFTADLVVPEEEPE